MLLTLREVHGLLVVYGLNGKGNKKAGRQAVYVNSLLVCLSCQWTSPQSCRKKFSLIDWLIVTNRQNYRYSISPSGYQFMSVCGWMCVLVG